MLSGTCETTRRQASVILGGVCERGLAKLQMDKCSFLRAELVNRGLVKLWMDRCVCYYELDIRRRNCETIYRQERLLY